MIKTIQATDDPNSMNDPTPYFLRAGLEVVWRELRLSPDLVVDLLLKDSQGGPVLALVAAEATASEPALLGRALLARSEFHSSRTLLAQFLVDRGINFDQPPLTLLLSARFSDRLLASVDGLAHLQVVELGSDLIELPTVRAGVQETAHQTPDKEVPASERLIRGVPAAEESETGSEEGDPVPVGSASPTPPRVIREPSVSELVDEAKRMILRINRSIEEEVDGDLVRFNVGERVLAVLSIGDDQLSLYVGDEPDRPRLVRTAQDLDEAINAIIERSFALTGIAARLGN